MENIQAQGRAIYGDKRRLICSKCGKNAYASTCEKRDGVYTGLCAACSRIIKCKSCETEKTINAFFSFNDITKVGLCSGCKRDEDKIARHAALGDEHESAFGDHQYRRICQRCFKPRDIRETPFWIVSCGPCWRPEERDLFYQEWLNQNRMHDESRKKRGY